MLPFAIQFGLLHHLILHLILLTLFADILPPAKLSCGVFLAVPPYIIGLPWQHHHTSWPCAGRCTFSFLIFFIFVFKFLWKRSSGISSFFAASTDFSLSPKKDMTSSVTSDSPICSIANDKVSYVVTHRSEFHDKCVSPSSSENTSGLPSSCLTHETVHMWIVLVHFHLEHSVD